MKQARVNVLLFSAILVMTVLPLFAALYFVDQALETSLNLGFNSQIVDALETDSRNLKTLGRLDGERQKQYRDEFERIENLKAVYNSPEIIEKGIRRSLTIYFSLGVAAALFMSVATAALLGRRISHSFRAAFDELAKQRDRVRYLEEISSWQEFAKILAHEIKNPLTPIKMLVTSLADSYREQAPEKFAAQLARMQTMVDEELAHLNDTVNKFSDFAKIPSVRLIEADISMLLAQHVKAISATLDRARVSLVDSGGGNSPRAKIDSTLFRQVLTNILRNGIEANPGRSVNFTVTATGVVDTIQITIENDGVPVPADMAPRIFDPYITAKAGNDNMGLGLAIARKIVIEHGGDIVHEERSGRPAFVITLPRLA